MSFYITFVGTLLGFDIIFTGSAPHEMVLRFPHCWLRVLGYLFDLSGNGQADRSMDVMKTPFTQDQIDDISRMYHDAMDHAVDAKPDTRMEFAWVSFSYLLGALNQNGALWPAIRIRYHALADHYGQLSLGKEVSNSGRGT